MTIAMQQETPHTNGLRSVSASTPMNGIKASIVKYGATGKQRNHCLRLCFNHAETAYASAELVGVGLPKIRTSGTIGDGLLVWFDYHQGAGLRRSQYTEEPQLEGYINVALVRGKEDSIGFIFPKYSRVTEGGKRAFRLEPLPEFAAAPLNTITLPLDDQPEPAPAPVANGKPPLKVDRTNIADIVRRHSSSPVMRAREEKPSSAVVERPAPAVLAAKPAAPAGAVITTVIKTPQAIEGDLTEAKKMLNELVANVSGYLAAPEKAEADIRFWRDTINEAVQKLPDARTIALKLVDNRLEVVRRRVVIQEEVL